MDGPGTWRAGALTADRCGCRGPQRRAKLDFPHFARSGSHSLWWDLSVRRDYAGVGPVMGHRKNPPASMRGSDTRDESRRIDPRRRQRSSVVKPRTGSSGRWRVAHAALAVRFANMQCSSRRQCGEPQRAAEAACRFSNRECTWPQRLSAGLPTVSAMKSSRIPERPPPARWVGTRAPPHDKIAETRAKLGFPQFGRAVGRGRGGRSSWHGLPGSPRQFIAEKMRRTAESRGGRVPSPQPAAWDAHSLRGSQRPSASSPR